VIENSEIDLKETCAMSNTTEVVYLDGRTDHNLAPKVRSMITVKKVKIAEAFLSGNVHLATHLASDLHEFLNLNGKYLVPNQPAAKRR
jgi:hypothetical protein